MKIIRSLLISLCIATMLYVTWYHMPTKFNTEIIRSSYQTSFVTNYSYSELLNSHETLEPEAVQDAIITKNKNINFTLYFIFLGMIIGFYTSLYFALDVLHKLFSILLRKFKFNSLFKRVFKKKKEVYYVHDLPKKE